MNTTTIHKLLKQGEGLQSEFKKAKEKLPASVFESICAFLNSSGGDLFLGVDDNGEVLGVDADKAERLSEELINNSNNAQKMYPPVYLAPEIIEIKKKKIIYMHVPCSSEVHSTVGKTYERNGDADQDISKNNKRLTQLFLRKQTTFSENTIYPYLKNWIPFLFQLIA